MCIVLIGGVGAGAVGWKFYKKVQENSLQIRNQQLTISKLVTRDKANRFDSSIFKDDTYNYLAIGNSLTYHSEMSYWWNEGVGMAASDADHDYVHVLKGMLSDGLKDGKIKSGWIRVTGASDVICGNLNFSDWELQSYDRGETLTTLDSYLVPNLDLVTIQLGENVTDSSTLESDYEDLINYVKEKAPKAEVVVIGEFWKDSDKDSIKKQACSATGAVFVDLSSMWNDSSYEAGMGTVVYGSDGKEHKIEHDGVATHPGDKGMAEIAKLTCEAIEK